MSALVILPGQGKAVHMGGLGVIFKLWGTDTGGKFSLVEHPLSPGALGAPLHTHRNEDEASYVLEGEITFQIGEEVIRATPGTLIYKPKEIPHTFWNQSEAPARILEIISPAGFEHYFDELAKLVSAGGQPDVPSVMKLAQKYGLEFDVSRMAELAEKYHVSLEGSG